MIKGKIYMAYAQKDVQQTRPLYAFVPNDVIKEGKLDIVSYSSKRWDSINCGANQEAVGSHVFPDISKPIKQSEVITNPNIANFLKRLKKLTQKSFGKPSGFRKPGWATIPKSTNGPNEPV